MAHPLFLGLGVLGVAVAATMLGKKDAAPAAAAKTSSGWAYIPGDPRSKAWKEMGEWVGPVDQVDIT